MTDIETLLTVRMDYAWFQFEELRDAFIQIGENWSNKSIAEPQADGVTYLFKANVPEIDPLLRIKTGEFVHQVHATLENLAWALARRASRDPGRVSFPITRNPTEFANTCWVKLLGVDARCVLKAEKFQPYNRPEGNLLVILHRLWNLDKHRVATALPIVPANAILIWQAHNEGLRSFKIYGAGSTKPVQNGQVLARLVMKSPDDAPPKGGVILQASLDVRGPFEDRKLPHALYKIYSYVRDEIVPALVPFL
jgi:hypothetical protein